MAGKTAKAAGGKTPLTVCYPFSGDALGGSHVSVLGMMELLDPRQFRTIVVPEFPDGKIARHFHAFEQMIDPGNPPSYVPGEAFTAAKFLRGALGTPARVRFLREHRVDIVHLNDGRSCANWAVAARLAGCRVLWHHRGNPDSLGLRFAAPLLAHRVACVSRFALPRPGAWSSASRAEVIHSPFDTDITVDRAEARRALLQDLGMPEDTFLVGYFGAFVPRKRPEIFVDTIAALDARLDRPVAGVMFGEARTPEMSARLDARIAECAAPTALRRMGYRSPGAFWIAACDVLLVPAVEEPFGRTLIEAMLVGTPVVAARSGGNIEALADGAGVLVPVDDPASMAEACARLAQAPDEAEALALHACRQAKELYGADRHVESVIALYRKLAA
jgi:Glycosyltransferase